MRIIIRNNLALTLLAILFTAFSAIKVQQVPQAPWPVPDEYKNMENPTKGDVQGIKIGGMLYKRYCVSCHGRTGQGNGPGAKELKSFSVDFSAEYFRNQTDGEHFYKTLKGRNEMPGYENKVAEEDIWAIVSYMRTFEK